LALATRRITNRLLDRLPAKDCARVLDACEPVELEFQQVLEDPGTPIRNVYFPTSSFISLLASVRGGGTIEVALAGNEGVYGVPIAFGITASPVRALVQGGGLAWRMSPQAFQQELARLPSLRGCVNQYLYVVMSQLMQTAGCNRFHVVEQRLARWLLMTADRSHSPTFRITHEFLAYMLGVRRVGVTEAASALQKRGLIGYARGVVTILDRKGLERASCGCYRSDINAYETTFGRPALRRAGAAAAGKDARPRK
jgi:CRP-like cAMP-binding protein